MADSKVKGTMVRFFRGRGFGFIKPQEGGKEVFVHWEDLVTDDHYPYVEKGTEVEFLLVESDGNRSAKEVTLADGEEIPVFTKPYEDREVNEDEVYMGAIKFFDGRKGFGFVEPDQEISWGEVSSGEGLFFKRDSFVAVNAGKGMMLRIPDGMRVSFKVYKDKKGLGACEIQKEDQTPIEGEPRPEKKQGGGRKRKRKGGDGNKKATKRVKKTKEELIEEREIDEEETTYIGTVKYYKPEKEFGFITITEDITFKDITVKEKIFVMKEDIVCYADEVNLLTDSEVMFKIYKDSKGLGACEVMNADGTPITGKVDEAEAEVVKEPSPEPAKPKKKAAAKGKKKKVTKRKKKSKN